MVGAGAGGASTSGAGGRAGSGGASAAGAAGQSGSAGAGGALGNVTIWIAGDSTVATGGPCPIGWGGKFKALFNSKVTVTNSAVGGRSVRTWLYDVQDTKDSAGECNLAKDAQGNPTVQERWTAMLTGMKAGDYLFIQFGINDGDSTCPRHVGQDAFKTTYGMMAQAAKDRGAFPIFVTPVSQIACSGSTVSKGTREPYVSATKAAGTQSSVPVLDLNVLSTTLYQSLGFCPIPGGDVSASTTGAVGTFFCDDHTHFDTTGATQIAGLVAGALKTQNIPLAKYLL
jgi:lysophospholipase L1-like esterase